MARDSIERRRGRVRRLLAKGADTGEIAARLDVSKRTIQRDVSALEDDLRDIQQGDADRFLTTLDATYQTLRDECWTIYHQNRDGNDAVALGALKELRRVTDSHAERLAELGVFPDAPDRVEFGVDEGGAAMSFEVYDYGAIQDQQGDAEDAVAIEIEEIHSGGFAGEDDTATGDY